MYIAKGLRPEDTCLKLEGEDQWRCYGGLGVNFPKKMPFPPEKNEKVKKHEIMYISPLLPTWDTIVPLLPPDDAATGEDQRCRLPISPDDVDSWVSTKWGTSRPSSNVGGGGGHVSKYKQTPIDYALYTPECGGNMSLELQPLTPPPVCQRPCHSGTSSREKGRGETWQKVILYDVICARNQYHGNGRKRNRCRRYGK